MTRLQLDLPEKFVFGCEMSVRASDLNYGGHVGNDRMLTLMQEARILFYNHLGFKDELHLDGDVGQVISDALVIYKSESFLGDHLRIKIAVGDFTKYGFDLIYLVINQTTGKEAARGKTGIVCFDYMKRKVASVPPQLLALLQQ